MSTVTLGDYEWETDKAASNVVDHDGVAFEDAIQAIEDPHVIIVDASTPDEDRLAAIGASARGIVYVVHIERGARTRIISARRATRRERALYRAQ